MCGLCLDQAQPQALREARQGDQMGNWALDIRAQTLSADIKVCQNKVVYLYQEVQLYLQMQ